MALPRGVDGPGRMPADIAAARDATARPIHWTPQAAAGLTREPIECPHCGEPTVANERTDGSVACSCAAARDLSPPR